MSKDFYIYHNFSFIFVAISFKMFLTSDVQYRCTILFYIDVLFVQYRCTRKKCTILFCYNFFTMT